MVSSLNVTPTQISLAHTLEQNPIHLSGQIQPHGVVFILDETDLSIIQTSTNTYGILGIAPQNIIGKTLDDLFDSFQIDPLKRGLTQDNLDYVNPTKLWSRVSGDEYVVFDAVFHRNFDGFLVLELEPAISQESIPFLSFYHLAKASISELQNSAASLKDFCEIIVKEVRNLTGFDRVMLYRFDEENHGDVIAEAKVDEMESYLGLRFPESDIPAPARRLFSANYIRLIPDIYATPVSLYPEVHPETHKPSDLTLSILRSAYHCHLEYLHNMGVESSLTISLIHEEKLWGLIACHHRTPKFVPYELRKACEFLGRVVFNEIAVKEETEDYDYRMKLANVQSQLVGYMSEEDSFVKGLIDYTPNLLDLTSAKGAAIFMGEDCITLGETPNPEDLNFLLQWVKLNNNGEIFQTDSLPSIYSDALNYKNIASGLLAVPISQRNYVMWFRPEVIQTVNWGGDPNNAFEAVEVDGEVQLSPRKSFELWKETVRLKSLPWKGVEIKAALELRKAITNIILRQADELAQLAHDLSLSNAELKKFAYVASHDLQEPLNQVANYVQLLEMRYQEELDEDAGEFIQFAVDGVSLMQTLIDDVLAYSKVDIQGVEFELTDSEKSLQRALANLRGRINENNAIITHDPLPTLMADSTQLMQLFQNLIGNGIKFRSDRTPEIHISSQRLEDAWLFSVKDNGIGIDSRFFERIFIIFQRLHTRDEYQGTGMGLAICKKIIECHRGQIWVESEIGQGSTFTFTLPIGGRDRDHRRGRSN